MEPRLLLAADPVINEFMASNSGFYPDRDGDFPDWIEIYNRGDEPLDLNGWSLTDSAGNLAKWRFPSRILEPGQYLIVFASGKDRRTGPDLHTNFRLEAAGEYLALVRPDGSVHFGFGPQYPPQTTNISYGIASHDPLEFQFFTQPTPGVGNAVNAVAPPVFSRTGRAFTGTLTLTLATDTPQAEIRYTLNGTVPGPASPLYTGPITLNNSTVVRARALRPGFFSSPIVSETFFALDSTVQNFESNLPVVIVDTFGAGLNDTTLTPVAAAFIDTAQADGRARMLDLPDFAGRGGLRLRGQTSQGFPKRPYAFETWDEQDRDRSVSILGMPAESDWILYNPYSEKSLMQNFLAYQWSNRMGQYAVRTRFVELFVNGDGGGRINYNSDYVGIYIFMERIKVDSNRVDITPLSPNDNLLPNVTGGYVFKKDKFDAGERGFRTSRGQHLLNFEPDENEITPQQQSYLLGYINAFEAALYGPNFRDPVTGYRAYIDVDSWIDHHILVELSKNIDGFRLSTYYHKDRNGKIRMGPIWDYNLSMGNADYLQGNVPTGWYYSQLSDNEYPYWRRLFQDPEFQQRWIDRWQELRRDVLSTDQIMADIDELVGLLSDHNGNFPVGRNPTQPPNNPIVRNYRRWNVLGTYLWPNGYVGNSWMDDVNYMKNFLRTRADWIDNQYIAAPLASRAGGKVTVPFQLTLSAARGTIYYTTDGSDPRLPGGAIDSRALSYSGPITIGDTTRLRARAHFAGQWSGLIDEQYIFDKGLRITELNYHPYAAPSGSAYTADDFEFIELRNTGNQAINLAGYQFTNGIAFTFSASDPRILQPGEFVVLVNNPQAFAQRYPDVEIGGVYTDTRLNNGGERIRLADPTGATVHDFRYSDSGDWPGRADGKGSSLEIIDPEGNYDDPRNWRSSAEYGGSPGAAGSGRLVEVVVNEVLTHTDLPLRDAVELHNVTDAPINISGWFLSDSSADYRKFRIPDGTIITPGGYIVFDESHFNPTPQSPAANHFAFSAARGDEVWLLKADTGGNLLAFADSVDFGAAASGEAFGRWPDGEGRLYPMLRRTLGGPNSGPRIGPVIISELMYSPSPGNGNLEYIELVNITDSPVDVAGWRFDKGVDFVFPAGTNIGPQQALLVIPFDPNEPLNSGRLATFRSTYGIGGAVPLVGGYQGFLDNSGERLRLVRPDEPPLNDPDVLPLLVVDEVRYEPTGGVADPANGGGQSLTRASQFIFGNDPANWSASPPTPGSAPFSASIFQGTDSDDAYHVRLDPTGNFIEIYRSASPAGTPTFTVPWNERALLVFAGGNGNDQVVLHWENGSPIPPGGLIIDGGGEPFGGDSLTAVGDGAAAGSFRPDSLVNGDGELSIDGRMIYMSGVGPVSLSNLASFSLSTAPDAEDRLTVTAPAPGQTSISGTSGPAAFGPISLIDVGALMIDTSSGDEGSSMRDTLMVDSAIISFNRWQKLASLSIAGSGRVTLDGSEAQALRLGSLWLGPEAILDLNDQALILQRDPSNSAADLAQVLSQIAAGRNGGAWNGRGITSSTAGRDATGLTGLAAILNRDQAGIPIHSHFAGQAVDESSILIKRTWHGDMDLNGVIDIDDYFLIDVGFLDYQAGLSPNPTYRQGDLDFNDMVDIDDYFLIDTAFLGQDEVL